MNKDRNVKVPSFKYYNLCLPEEILQTAKLNAVRKNITLKEYLTNAIIEANIKEAKK